MVNHVIRIFLAVIVLVVSSCVSTKSTETIIEKSKANQPSWVKKPVDQIFLANSLLIYCGHYEDSLELPIIMRSLFQSSIQKYKAKLESSLLSIAKDTLKKKEISFDLNNPYFQKPFKATLKKLTKELSEVSDIYFEKVLTETNTPEISVTTKYRAWIKINLEKQVLLAELNSLGEYFKKRKTPELRIIGDGLSSIKLSLYFQPRT